MNQKIKVVLIGAGNRGTTYTDLMAQLPEKYEVVAVAEPIENRREYIRQKHRIPEEFCFESWNDLFAKGKVADAAIISTQDKDHFEPAIKAISLGYHLLLEKPVSPTPEECWEICRLAEEKDVKVVVCHVLRYAPLFEIVKKTIDEGKLGKIISINHEECVGNIHQSHSYVRGNWGNEGRSSNMLLAKSCHDLDLLQWLTGKKCKKIQSFGALTHFRIENAPEGSPEFCIEGCPVGDKCPYNAVKLYLEDKENLWFRTTSTRDNNPTDEKVEKAIRTTQYGKCVYRCDNDVVDHQVVTMLLEDDITVTFSMNAFNRGGRYLHLMGTKGELHAALDNDTPIRIYDFETAKTTEIAVIAGDGVLNGHGGGDEGIVDSFYEYLLDNYKGSSISDIRTSVSNHLLVFAAEKARKEECVVDFGTFLKTLENR